jgi:hypothetical protein
MLRRSRSVRLPSSGKKSVRAPRIRAKTTS